MCRKGGFRSGVLGSVAGPQDRNSFAPCQSDGHHCADHAHKEHGNGRAALTLMSARWQDEMSTSESAQCTTTQSRAELEPCPSFPCFFGKKGKEDHKKTRFIIPTEPLKSLEKKGKTLEQKQGIPRRGEQKTRNSPKNKERKDREGANGTNRFLRKSVVSCENLWFPAVFSEHAAIPQGPCHIKNTTVILIHYSGGKNNTTVAKHYGRVSETPCFPGENSQEISTDSE